MSACGTFTEHVWKPGECKNCFKPKSLHRLGQQAAGCKASSEQRPPAQTSTHLQLHQNQNHLPPGSKPSSSNNNNPGLTSTGSSQRAGTGPASSSSATRSAHFRPPVAKKPTIAVKPTMMLLPGSPTAAGLDSEGNLQRSPPPQEETPGGEAGKNASSPFTDVWKLNGLNQKRPHNVGPNNNNEGEVGLGGGGGRGGNDETDSYGPLSPRAPSRNNNNNGLTDVLKEIAGLVPGPLSGSRDLFFGRINTSYRRSLERGLPASGCLAMGSGGGGGGEVGGAHKRVSLSDSAKVISTEGGRFCYPEFSSEDEDEEEEEEDDDDDDEEESDDDDEEHESWDESDEELLAMEIRMRGQPRFSNFRAATLSPVPFMVGKDKWNTVPLRNRSLQRICAVDYDDSYDEILNGYPSPIMDSNGALLPLPYGPAMGFLSHSESVASPESSSSLPEESRTTSSSGSSAPCGLRNGLHSPSSPPSSSSAPKALPLPSAAATKREPDPRTPQSPTRVLETHKAVLAIRLEEQDGRDRAPMPQALPGQPVTISFSPTGTEEQAKPYRVVNLEKPLICKPYTVVDVSASMASKEDATPELFTPKHKTPCSPTPCSPVSFSASPSAHPLSPVSPASPLSSPISPTTTTSDAALPGNNTRRKPGNIRYQEVWTSSTSPRQKIPKVELGVQFSSHPGPAIPPRHCSHKSAPTSPIAGLSSSAAASSCSSRTVPVKSSNLSEIKFNSYNNAGMPPFPIIIRDEPAYYARSSKNAVKVPIVINPSAYDNLAVYKSFLGLSGELPPPKGGPSGSVSAAAGGGGGGGSGARVVSHTYEEIGSSESIQSSSTEKTLSGKGTSERASFDEARATPDTASTRNQNLHSLHSKTTTTDSGTVSSTVLSLSAVGPVSPSAPDGETQGAAFTGQGFSAARHRLASGGDTLSSKGSSTGTDYSFSFGTGLSHREEASAVLSQIVASIQPPQSPPEEPPSSPAPQSKTFGSEDLYSLPPNDSSKESSLFRPKSLFTSSVSTDGCLSKPGRKEASSKLFPKSQSASSSSAAAAVASPPSSPKSTEPGAPFPPPRSTSSPYHASSILQRHFSNWTSSKSSAPSSGSSPSRPGEGDSGLASPSGGGAEGGRRGAGAASSSEAAKPKRWISFKSFFRRRKDEDEQKTTEKDKDKGKLVGLDGTVIHMLPPPPLQRQHWFTEAKPEDPTQKPTIIFSYRPDGGDGEGEPSPRVEECKETSLLSEGGGATVSPTRTPSPLGAGPDLLSQVMSHVPIISSDARGGGASLPAKLELSSSQEAGLCLKEGLGVDVGVASEGSTSLGEEPEEDGSHSHHSNSPASSSCSATYSNLGQSRANMIPLKQPRNIKASDDTLASIDDNNDYDNNSDDQQQQHPALPPLLLPKATPPPPLPKKSSSAASAPPPARSNTEPNLPGLLGLLGNHHNNNKDTATATCLRGAVARAEAKPGGTNLSVANPLYDLDSTWETASQSSSLSSEPPHHQHHQHQQAHPHPNPRENGGGDSLERPGGDTSTSSTSSVSRKSRPANSLSSLVSPPSSGAAPPPSGAGSSTAGGSRERRGYRSTECLTSRVRTTGRGAAAGGGGGSKPHRPVLYRGMDSWEEVVGRIRGLHTDTLRKLAAKCEDRFMAGQKDHLRFGTDSWSHFRLTTGKPCCEAGDAVYYTASYAKDPLVNYAIKICRSKVKATQQQFFHSLAVRQSLSVHFNIQQDCGHFLADVPARLLPWEEEEGEEDAGEEEEEEEEEVDEGNTETVESTEENTTSDSVNSNGKPDDSRAGAGGSHAGTPPGGRLSSRVVVITREVPFQTVADFVREGVARHTRNPELYERQVCLLMLQLCSGLEHMKPYHVTHCDLRLENLLLVHCHLGGALCNNEPSEPNNNNGNGGASSTAGASANNAAANSTCPARLIISNFSQAKQKSPALSSSSSTTATTASDRETMHDQSRLAPELVTATQYRKCDEFQTGILIYEMLHRPNPFEETPELKEREYTWADLPPLPVRSLYSQGLQQLASLLLTVNPSERIRMAEARACLQCLLWGPREDLFQALGGGGVGGGGGGSAGGQQPAVSEAQRETTLQNWLDLKRTLMMIKFAERSLDAGGGVSLEDWLCCQYLAFTTTDSLSRVVHILQQTQSGPQAAASPPQNPQTPPNPNPSSSAVHLAQPQTQTHLAHHTFHMKQTQPL